MSRQPYIYTLPEQFIEDKSVPAHWKLYTIINGFWLSGREVFASNQFFAEKLGCGERNIRMCLEKLEEMGLVERTGLSQRRRIIPGGGTVASGQGGSEGSAGAEVGLPHISDSISEREYTALEDEPRTYEAEKVYESDTPDGELGDSKSPRISGDKRKAYDELIAWSENERGFKFLLTHKTKQYSAFKLANKNGITREQLMERWEEMSGETFWQKNGYDWMNVVTSFNTKPA